jgi:hypothetical protein
MAGDLDTPEENPDTPEGKDEIRSAAEIARRALCLFAMIGLAAGADREEVWK